MCPQCRAMWRAHFVDNEVLERMSTLRNVAVEVRYVVSMPMVEDDVVYDVRLAACAADVDSLLGVNYLIEWTLHGGEGDAVGFVAYFVGHHYRYRNNRLLEYHADWDVMPFETTGGVQRTAPFVDVLPTIVAGELRKMIDAEDYEVTYADSDMNGGVGVFSATQRVDGVVGCESRFEVETATGRVIRIEKEFNPGQISEQTVSIVYRYQDNADSLRAVTSERALVQLYPEVFEKYRESNYRVEHLRGMLLPEFSLPRLSGGRYTHQKGGEFAAPTVVAVIDPAVDSSRNVVKMLRDVQAKMPRRVDVLLAFMGNDIVAVEQLVGDKDDDEVVAVISAKSLARDCGVTVFPTFLVVSPSGRVTDVLLGVSSALEQDLMQSLVLL